MDNSNSLFISLFEGDHVRLATRDPEKDAEIESRWTHDPDYLRSIQPHGAVPHSPGHIRKRYEGEQKDKEKEQFVFGIHAHSDDRLLGFVGLERIQWSHGTARVTIAIGDPRDRGHGYGTEALNMILHYAFNELNLFLLSANAFEYNTRALAFLERAGFKVQARRREALHRDRRRWDVLILALLRGDWERSA